MPLITVNKIDCDSVVFKEKKDFFLIKMAFWLMFTALGIVVALVYVPIPPTGVDTAKYTVGFLFGTMLGTLVTNLYGTSQSSKDAKTTIDKQIQNAADVAKVSEEKKEVT